MFEKIALRIVSHYVKKHIIKEEDTEIYAYGFELLIATLVNGFLLILMAVLTRSFCEAILYAAAFILLRTFAGGYHASTHLFCLLLLLLTYGLTVGLFWLLPVTWYQVVAVAFGILSLCLVFLFSPVENSNNPFTPQRRKKLQIKSRIFVSILTLMVVGMAFALPQFRGGLALACGEFSVAASLIHIQKGRAPESEG